MTRNLLVRFLDAGEQRVLGEYMWLNCTCLKSFDDMTLLVMGVEMREERKEEERRPMLASRIAAPRIRDNMGLSDPSRGSDSLTDTSEFSADTTPHLLTIPV